MKAEKLLYEYLFRIPVGYDIAQREPLFRSNITEVQLSMRNSIKPLWVIINVSIFFNFDSAATSATLFAWQHPWLFCIMILIQLSASQWFGNVNIGLAQNILISWHQVLAWRNAVCCGGTGADDQTGTSSKILCRRSILSKLTSKSTSIIEYAHLTGRSLVKWVASLSKWES